MATVVCATLSAIVGTPSIRVPEPCADLTVEAVYEGGTAGNTGDDPLGKLIPVGNQGGFRYAGSPRKDDLRLVVLYTRGGDRDWPDALDRETGLFNYFGIIASPARNCRTRAVVATRSFAPAFTGCTAVRPRARRSRRFLLFNKASQVGGRAVQFLGLAAPGARDVQPAEDLIAIWRTSGGERFQNYRATFTILDIATVPRAWLNELAAGQMLGQSCPKRCLISYYGDSPVPH